MSKIKLLDCTLRDGGYINQWKFGKKAITNIVQGLILSGIDIVECGFLSNEEYHSDFSLFQRNENLTHVLPQNKAQCMYAAMIAVGEKEIDPSQMPHVKDSLLDCIRISFHSNEKEIEKAFHFANILKKKGFLVCMQPIGTTGYTDAEVLLLIDKINELSPYAFYLVDTLGVMYKQDILHMLYLTDYNLNGEIKIGFHSHNNLQMSFANAQEIVEYHSDREFILDGSVFGMGRGAGNLCTEIIADFLNKTMKCNYDILPLLEIIDEQLMSIYTNHPWGYSPGYFLSAAKNCHPNYASNLLAKQSLRARSIGILLDQIPVNEKHIFDEKLIENIYYSFQQHTIDDSEVKNKLKQMIQGREVMVLAPGRSIKLEREKISAYIDDKKPFIISVNFIPDFDIDLMFISNRKRYSSLNTDSKVKVLFTSNIMERPQESMAVNYLDLLNSSGLVADNAGLMLLKLLSAVDNKRVILAGFDGFSQNQAENFFKKEFIGAVDPKETELRNNAIEEQLKIRAKDLDIIFLTHTMYKLF